MKRIKYEMTWCDYLTPCPYNKKDKQDDIMVGSWECYQCPYNDENAHDSVKDHKEHVVYCNCKK